MEIEENTESIVEENQESSVLDVESVEDSTQIFINEENVLQEKEKEDSEPLPGTSSNNSISVPEKKRLVRLPLARIKHIMKMDPDCTIVGQDTVFLVTKATEMFLEYLGRESGKYTQMAKRKTVLKRDVEAAIDSIPHLCFLEGALE